MDVNPASFAHTPRFSANDKHPDSCRTCSYNYHSSRCCYLSSRHRVSGGKYHLLTSKWRRIADLLRSLNNVTLRFFTDDQDCESSDTIAPAITTGDIPTELICFNLTSTFTGNKTSGIQEALAPWEYPDSNITYRLQQNDFNSGANYTRIRYELPSIDGEEGERASWTLWVYPHLNCATEVKGVDNYEYPWYEVDCKTDEEGQCQEVNYPIRSFSLLHSDRTGECKTWAKLGAATKAWNPLSRLFCATVAVAVAFVIL
ncbi:hypothetical protein LB507_006694 [Fusarium sp. FIESC RH6]|nr:hypothetical protein LB507_006694 [Fusarium sp. FIESC RH6]